MASGESGTASDSSNIGSNVGALIGGAIGSLAGPAVSEKGASIGGAVACTAKYINNIIQKAIKDIMLDEQVPIASNYQ